MSEGECRRSETAKRLGTAIPNLAFARRPSTEPGKLKLTSLMVIERNDRSRQLFLIVSPNAPRARSSLSGNRANAVRHVNLTILINLTVLIIKCNNCKIVSEL